MILSTNPHLSHRGAGLSPWFNEDSHTGRASQPPPYNPQASESVLLPPSDSGSLLEPSVPEEATTPQPRHHAELLVLTNKQSSMRHRQKILQFLEAAHLLKQVKIMHWQRDMGNQKADREAKRAALKPLQTLALFPLPEKLYRNQSTFLRKLNGPEDKGELGRDSGRIKKTNQSFLKGHSRRL